MRIHSWLWIPMFVLVGTALLGCAESFSSGGAREPGLFPGPPPEPFRGDVVNSQNEGGDAKWSQRGVQEWDNGGELPQPYERPDSGIGPEE